MQYQLIVVFTVAAFANQGAFSFAPPSFLSNLQVRSVLTTAPSAVWTKSSSSDGNDSSPEESFPTNDENPFAPESKGTEEAETPASRPKPSNPLTDPLVRMATNPSPTKTVPLLGEIPLDGSLVVLLPAAAIAVLGAIASLFVAYNARDDIIQSLASVNPPPPRKQVISDKCRGICSSQEESFESLQKVMGSWAKTPPSREVIKAKE